MKRALFIMLLIVLVCVPKSALAIPGLQVYIEGSTAGDFGGDEETWLIPSANDFNLHVIGAYGNKDISITECTLLATVLQSETGAVSGLGTGIYHDTLSFLPSTTPSLNHFPLNKPNLYDFYTFDLGSLTKATTGLNNYDASDGSIELSPNAVGEDKIFNVGVTGFTYIHFDAFAKFTDDKGYDWVANPGSHDAADPEIPGVPEPATLMLLGTGLLGFRLKRNRVKK